MPEIEIFATRADHTAFAQFILAQGTTLVPSLFYGTRRYEKISNAEQFVQSRKSAQLFLITHPSFTTRPIDMNDVDRKEGRRYFLEQRSGGASILWRAPKGYRKAGVNFLASDTLGHHASYQNRKTDVMETVPAELIAFYRRLAREIKRTGAALKTTHRHYWATANALEKHGGGCRFIGVDA